MSDTTLLNDIAEVLINTRTPIPEQIADPIVRIRQQIGASWGDSKEELMMKLGRAMMEMVNEGTRRWETRKHNREAVAKLLDNDGSEEALVDSIFPSPEERVADYRRHRYEDHVISHRCHFDNTCETRAMLWQQYKGAER